MASSSEVSPWVLPLKPNFLPLRVDHGQSILIFIIYHWLIIESLLEKQTEIIFVFLIVLIILNNHLTFEFMVMDALSIV